MPFALAIIGLALLISGARGTEHELGQQLAKDFSGSGSFLYWIAAILAVGSVGYVPQLKRASDALMVLMLISFTLSNGGVWAKLQSAIANPPNSVASVAVTDTGGSAQTASNATPSPASFLADIPGVSTLTSFL